MHKPRRLRFSVNKRLKNNRRKHGAKNLDKILERCGNRCENCGVPIIRMKVLLKLYSEINIRFCKKSWKPQYAGMIACRKDENSEWEYFHLATIEHAVSLDRPDCNHLHNLQAFCFRCNQDTRYEPLISPIRAKICKLCGQQFMSRTKITCYFCRCSNKEKYLNALNHSLTSSYL